MLFIKQTKISQLNLVDLAGSERVSVTEAEGNQLQEANAINKSVLTSVLNQLSELGSAINSIATNQRHIPYRNSKLTYLLKNCLDGSSKLVMILNVSPSVINFNETLSSLNFGVRCKSVEMNNKNSLK